MGQPLFSIIVPTFNNPQFFNACFESIAATGILTGLGEVIVINNGKQPIKERYGHFPNTKVIDCPENLGWERGLEEGLKHTTAPFVCFQNDDTHIPFSNRNFYSQLLHPFSNANVAAVGPITTVAAGWHSIYSSGFPKQVTEVSFLIFFTVMVRRSALDAVGGIDVTAPGGDDLDLSIRFRKAGHNLLINPNAFIIHHAFKTGERVRGGPDVSGGWNSQDMTDNTNKWLIQKHGFKRVFQTKCGLQYGPVDLPKDSEGDVVRQFVEGDHVLELGCGFRKTVPHAIGVDMNEHGDEIPHVPGGECVSDVKADVSKPLPFPPLSQDTIIARHILEHCLNSIQTLRNWNKVLKMGGRMIIAVPNHEIINTIPLNPEHVVAFTPVSLKTLAEVCGFKQISMQDPHNGISFVTCFEKVLHMAEDLNGKALELTNA